MCVITVMQVQERLPVEVRVALFLAGVPRAEPYRVEVQEKEGGIAQVAYCPKRFAAYACRSGLIFTSTTQHNSSICLCVCVFPICLSLFSLYTHTHTAALCNSDAVTN